MFNVIRPMQLMEYLIAKVICNFFWSQIEIANWGFSSSVENYNFFLQVHAPF